MFPILFIILFFNFNCASPSSDYKGSGNSVIYENDNTSKIVTTNPLIPYVKSLTFLLALKVRDLTNDNYVVVDQIKNIDIKLNSKKIGSYSSFVYDIEKVEKVNKNNFYIRREKFFYQVDIKIVDFTAIDQTTDLTTGKISKILNGTLNLGDYIFEINNLEFASTINSNLIKRINPHFIKNVSIKEPAENFFIGEIELLVGL